CQHVLACLRQTDMGRAHASPAARNREEDTRHLLDESGLLFRAQHQVAIALLDRSEGSKNPAADAEIDRTHVRAFFGALKAQGDSLEVFCIHIDSSANEPVLSV